jgi:uncharacterized membrane protein YGL010W
MKTCLQQLTNYAGYHRDKRNIATHFVGIPMIVLAATILLARPAFWHFGSNDLPWVYLGMISPAWIVAVLLGAYYLVLDMRLGLIMCLLLALCLLVAGHLAFGSTTVWLTSGLGLLVAGWVIQFLGHYFEGRKPAFLDDINGLAIGPLFVVAEALFMLGLRRDLSVPIEAQVGPTLIRRAVVSHS